jgi:tRNA(Ile)-lysidine synthase
VTQDLFEQVRANGLLAPGRPVLVLLSGGRDSTCLLDLAARISGPGAVTALHVNYGLRDAAAADERHCARLCAELGVDLETRHPRPPETGNLQAWARDARYGAAAQLATGLGGDVAAGHTATDQVETILYRLASSPSRRALLGMSPREGLLIRPLLRFTREDTVAYCEHRGLDWVEDETNSTDRYARGRVRHGLVPALEAVHPGAVANVLALAGVLRDEAAVLDAVVDETLAGRVEIELARLRVLPRALRRLVVQRLADAAVSGLAAGVAARTEEVVAMGPSAALDLPSGVRAVSEGGTLRFVRQPKKGARPPAVGAAESLE